MVPRGLLFQFYWFRNTSPPLQPQYGPAATGSKPPRMLTDCLHWRHVLAFSVLPAGILAFQGSAIAAARTAAPRTHQKTVAALKIRTIYSNEDLDRAADFFVDAFWDSRENGLGERERGSLQRDQLRDWQRRYGETVVPGPPEGNRLLLAEDWRGRIVGCVSVSSGPYQRILESRINDGGFDPRKGKVEFEEPARPRNAAVPLMANLAVARSARRRGVGKKLAVAAERHARDFGYSEIVLLVEEGNTPAQKLYKRMGYQPLWKQGPVPKIDVSEKGVRSVKTTNLAMAKSLKQSPVAAFFQALTTLSIIAVVAPHSTIAMSTTDAMGEGTISAANDAGSFIFLAYFFVSVAAGVKEVAVRIAAAANKEGA